MCGFYVIRFFAYFIFIHSSTRHTAHLTLDVGKLFGIEMSPIPPYYRRSLSLGGLRKRKEIRAIYSPGKKEVIAVEGVEVKPEEAFISPDTGFNLPLWIRVLDVPLFPTTYEFINSGEVIYHSSEPPMHQISVQDRDMFSEGAKVMQFTLTTKKLDELGDYRLRKRIPSQASVMGESAQAHADGLIAAGKIKCKPAEVSWHWCHLIAFSMLPARRAQAKRNLFCSTAAANGQMANIETALRAWVIENNRPLGIEVTCSYLLGSHLGLRLRYRLANRKTGGLHSEYYDPLSPQFSEYDDLDAVYDRMCENLR